MIDKNFKRKVFNRSAKSYDDFSSLQDKVSDRLFDRLDLIKTIPNFILDLGCGTGRNGLILKKRYENLKLINYDFAEQMLFKALEKHNNILVNPLNKNKFSYICGDMEQLTFKDNLFDLVWSTNTLQWCNDLTGTFNNIKSILKPGGLFIFSTFGPRTLYELNNITTKLSKFPQGINFIDVNNINNLLLVNNFVAPRLDTEIYCLTYNNIRNLFLDLKSIGATNGFINKKNSLSGKHYLNMIAKQYEEYKVEGFFPATYEVIYGHAWNTKNE
jgi:malonyl-CoA O-methyltransferase